MHFGFGCLSVYTSKRKLMLFVHRLNQMQTLIRFLLLFPAVYIHRHCQPVFAIEISVLCSLHQLLPLSHRKSAAGVPVTSLNLSLSSAIIHIPSQ